MLLRKFNSSSYRSTGSLHLAHHSRRFGGAAYEDRRMKSCSALHVGDVTQVDLQVPDAAGMPSEPPHPQVEHVPNLAHCASTNTPNSPSPVMIQMRVNRPLSISAPRRGTIPRLRLGAVQGDSPIGQAALAPARKTSQKADNGRAGDLAACLCTSTRATGWGRFPNGELSSQQPPASPLTLTCRRCQIRVRCGAMSRS
jgi:hypothetical protein